MSALSKTDLKAIFVSGARPTETNFADLIDSYTQYSELLENIGSAISQDTGVLEIVSASATAHSILPTRLGGTGEGSLSSAQDAFFQGQTGLAIVTSANRFTNTNTFAATATNFISSATGSNEGPFLVLDKPNSQSDGDNLGAIIIKGADSGGNSSTYAKMRGAIVTTSAGNENGLLQLITVTSGNSAVRFNIGGGLFAVNSTDQGIDTISVPASAGYFHDSTRMPFGQIITSASVSATSTSTTIPYDDTPPQIDEGIEILAMDFTPQHAGSTLKIECTVFLSGNATVNQSVAIFQDSTSDALYATSEDIGTSGGQGSCYSFHFFVNASNTTLRTYRMRVGPASGTLYVNSNQGSDIFSTVGPECRMTITEIFPAS